MALMPEKDPGLWAAAIAWLVAHQPQLTTGVIAAAVAMCRVIYGGGRGRKIVLEGAICSLIAISLLPVLEYFALPPNLSVFAGCMVGFIGVEKLRDYSDRFMSRKVEG
ncbi:phage holin, lambda family [Pseudomonas sp. JQ170]|uniref:phage holin, lambda family n=1 Tax=unclassified Pseudomonas TaxID=196821 RepID=UPI002653B312|nr:MULTISPECIES: phage holin, lambda family [unclassified Pseudomonas]MDN7144142.1 phage holin, lambda family [Pseudomonas sp. JQ170]WRO77741.1 phage holin, lambda family [Pseudomonas sp. 170C]